MSRLTASDIHFTPAATLKDKPEDSALGFGRKFTDYMFTLEYDIDKGWHSPKILPYGNLPLDPASTVLHYSQSVFEGMKAYRTPSGISMFRPRDNFARFNNSCKRLSIPELDIDFAMDSLVKLLEIEKDWIPSSEGTSLYIRPTVIATDPFLGVHAAHKYLYYVILSPSGAYYPEGMAPVKIYVEDEFIRAVRGGLGFAKTGANYAASILAGEKAQQLGYTQVLWLDGIEKKYVEEVGSMNVFFKIGGKLVTPALNGSILPGITRDSVIKLADKLGIETDQTKIDVNELVALGRAGKIEEAFGSGTAAVISPIGWLAYKDDSIEINGGKTGELSQKLYDTLVGIQYYGEQDDFNWIYKL
jgi:branched-chain amino acid aminotransferase